ncbi:sugar transferase [Paenibacillus sp. N1-5-1-14]|uniref:sugar transferase n=1 Tax=Paenibacillus radicibacter TaxID=2972488 RepID=UPI0021595E33|nr:sugar transferase [Paenibacillus radicibacter]MCR8641079.1 sugar transferase [Paenibacillus radicibacter]
MSTISKFSATHFWIILMDLLWVHIGFLLAFWAYDEYNMQEAHLTLYMSFLPWITIAAFIVFYLFGLGHVSRGKKMQTDIYTSILSVLTLHATLLICLLLFHVFTLPASVYVAACATQVIFILTFHLTINSVNKKWFGAQKVIIISDSIQNCRHLEQKMANLKSGWFEISDFVLTTDWKMKQHTLKQVDIVLIQSDYKDKEELINYCTRMRIELMVIPALPELFLVNAHTESIDDVLVLSIKPPQLSIGERLYKRTFDFLVSSILLVLLSPLFLVLTIWIKRSSPGNALYSQIRSGLHGKEFRIYKFRSMVHNAEVQSGPMLATEKDPRITSVGRVLRATRLDELPQLFNVWKGDMSLIGPRPERPFFVEQFMEVIPTYDYRMSIRPGITGLAQIMGKYTTSAEDKHRFDLMYIRQYSFLLDLKIVLQTLLVILSKEQAEGVKQPVVVSSSLPTMQESANKV